MAAAQDLAGDSFWLNQSQVMEAEAAYQKYVSVQQFGAAPASTGAVKGSSLTSEIEKARNQIKQSLNLDKSGGESGAIGASGDVLTRIASLEKENKELRQVTSDLQAAVKKLEQKMEALDVGGKSAAPQAKPAAAAAKPAAKQEVEDSDDDIDLFGSSDEEDNAALEKLKEERVKAYNEKKAKKTAVIAKSNIILDVKPWDDETDMKELEKLVRSVAMDGLLWGTSKLVEVGYGIKKLQISCVVEDDKVSTDDLDEKICAFEDFVQSMDIAAFNKI